MQVSEEFAARLAVLEPDELGVLDGQPRLVESLRRLGGAAVRAVPSCCALSVTVQPLGQPCTVVLSAAAPDQPIVSSLRLSIAIDDEQRADLVLQAVLPGAFDALAALLPDGVGRSAPVLDQDLALPSASAADLVGQLDDLSAVGRAIGVLLGLGHPPDDAHLVLERRAADAGTDLPTAARRLLAEGAPPAPSD